MWKSLFSSKCQNWLWQSCVSDICLHMTAEEFWASLLCRVFQFSHIGGISSMNACLRSWSSSVWCDFNSKTFIWGVWYLFWAIQRWTCCCVSSPFICLSSAVCVCECDKLAFCGMLMKVKLKMSPVFKMSMFYSSKQMFYQTFNIFSPSGIFVILLTVLFGSSTFFLLC